jgi:hypothetical protein
MARREKRSRDTAQEMGITMVPAGLKGMGEIDDPHYSVAARKRFVVAAETAIISPPARSQASRHDGR